MPNSIAIFIASDKGNPRLNYVLDWIFLEQWHINYQLFSDEETWSVCEEYKINYSTKPLAAAQLNIKPQDLLSETGNIKTPQPAVQRWKKTTVLFYNQPGATVPFDIFSAIFFLISRYEEYLPFRPDKHGRYVPEASLAGQYRFLSEPVIDQWLFHLGAILKAEGIRIVEKPFQYQMTFDIDMVWKYKNRGKWRHWGGHLRDFAKLNFHNIRERTAVIKNRKPDTYFSFPQLETLHQQYNIHPVFFVLLGASGVYDRNVSGKNPEMRQFISGVAKKFQIGIHPSYGSHADTEILKSEIGLLASITGKPVIRSRQHFIKFTLPETYQNLLQYGVKDDYSMGYAGCNGFRAGTSRPFFWYDLKQEIQTELQVHPFGFMDATSRFYLRQNPDAAFKEWQKLFLKIKAVNGVFVSIWHNYMLSLDEAWLPVYEKVLDWAEKHGQS